MAKEVTTEPQQTAVQITADALAGAILTATEQLNGSRRQVPFGRHKLRTAFNPSGKDRKMTRIFYQNGRRAFENTLTDAEIDLIAKIKPGRFIDGLVQVLVFSEDNEEPGFEAVHLKYNCGTADQRMNLGSRVGKASKGDTVLRNLLQMCLDEYAEQQDVLKAARRKEIEEAIG